MRKVYVSVSYLFLYDEEDLGLGEDASRDELADAAADRVEEILAELTTMSYNDMEVEVLGEMD